MKFRHYASLLLAAVIALQGCDTTAPETTAYSQQAPVTIKTDEYGIPHIYGASDADTFYGQGYMMATLRPAQSEDFRYQSQGRLAEIYGEDKLTEDLFTRSMGFHRHAAKRWPAYQEKFPAIATAFEAFAAGINRKYAEYRASAWPMTIQAAGLEPADWTAVDVYAISELLSFGLSGSTEIKILFSLLFVTLGPEAFQDLVRFAPPAQGAIIPDFLDKLKSAPVYQALRGNRTPSTQTNPLALLRESYRNETLDLQGLQKGLQAISSASHKGSNNFAVHASHTRNGYALVEGDTHQGMPTPNPYVQMHLASARSENAGTSLDVIGASFPGAPGVVFGHNGHLAWTPTLAFADITDFYIEILDPAQRDTHVLRPEGPVTYVTWYEPFHIRQEDGSLFEKTIAMREIPGHGPIIPEEMLPIPLPLKISVRWAGRIDDGPVPSVLGLAQAHTIDAFYEALRPYSGGSISFAAGDTLGNIGYSAWTKIPVRPAKNEWPVWLFQPADQDVHWDGVIPTEQVPWGKNPDQGFVFSANQDPIGTTWDNDPANNAIYHGALYASGFRAHQLRKNLTELVARGDVTVADMQALELDRYSLMGHMLAPWLVTAATRRPDLLTPEMRDAIDELATWDFILDPKDTIAAWFIPWTFEFVADMLLDEIDLIESLSGNEMTFFIRAVFHWLEATRTDIDAIESGTLPFPSRSGTNYFDRRDTDKVETRDFIILDALQRTLAWRSQREAALGTDKLVLGDVVRLRFRHDLTKVAPELEDYEIDFPAGGAVDTISVGQYKAWEDGGLLDKFYISNAPSNRVIYEMVPGRIGAIFQWPGGQSEIPTDPHYLDLAPLYSAEEYRVQPYYEDEITAHLESEFVLEVLEEK